MRLCGREREEKEGKRRALGLAFAVFRSLWLSGVREQKANKDLSLCVIRLWMQCKFYRSDQFE
jgi:hypothetical protein